MKCKILLLYIVFLRFLSIGTRYRMDRVYSQMTAVDDTLRIYKCSNHETLSHSSLAWPSGYGAIDFTFVRWHSNSVDCMDCEHLAEYKLYRGLSLAFKRSQS